MKQLLLILSLLLFSFTTKAQGNYPIYVTPTLTPPYTLKLSDYGAVGSQNLIVSITVSDLNIVDLPVKLRIKMETVGVTIENPPTITTTPIYLNGGVNTLLFGQDLEDYFKLNNLVFKGYGKDTYRKTGQLPGGFYKFSVEVLHFNSNRLISNTGSATAWIVLGKPPLLKAPAENDEVGEYIGMPITFSWLESNVGSPVAKGNVQYKFEMWEMRVPDVHPNTIVASIPVFHEYSTFNSLYSLYPSTILMEPGMRYAWRVTATDVTGMVPFEQEGHSEVRTFTYKAKCENVSNVNGSAKGENGEFTWDATDKHTSFNIEVQQPESGWMISSETFDTKVSYFDLEAGKTYQIRVQGVCNGDPLQTSEFSDWERLTISKPKPLVNTDECPNCGCDDEVPDVELTNLELKTVQEGDTIINKTGTTRFIVRTVYDQGSNTYKGVFLYWAEIWGAKIICNYENLQVNTDNVIVNMDFESVYDPQYLLDVDAISDFINELADDAAILTTGTTVKDSIQLYTNFDQVIVRNDSVIAITVDKDGTLKEDYIDQSDNLDKTLIKDTSGEEVVINGKGQPMGRKEFESTGGNSRLLKDYNKKKEDDAADISAMINFSASAQQRYGFDAYSPIKERIQQYYPTLNNGYRAAFKILPAFGTDKVTPESQQGLMFKDQMGIKAMKQADDLVVHGSFDGAEVPLYAYRLLPDSSEQVVGKLQMLSYTPQSKKLYIIKVNDSDMPAAIDLQRILNDVYAQALISWQVQDLDLDLRVNFPGGNMTHGGSGEFTTYNADQKAIFSAFEQSGKTFERDAFYLFFIDDVQDKDKSIAGYMPLQRQAGFIYDNVDLNIVAHELAHGAFNLYHTFSEHQKIAEERETQNLMDYAGGTELWKYQWDLIHDPEKITLALFQDEEEGAYVEEGPISEVARFINTIRCAKRQEDETVNIHHAFNSYNVNIGDLSKLINRFRTPASDLPKGLEDASLKVYIDEGISSATDLYLGYHNFNLSVGDYERKTAEGNSSEQLVFSSNGKPIIFSLPLGTKAETQKEVIDWLERECGLKPGGGVLGDIAFDVEKDDVKELFSLSNCQLVQLNKEDRKELIGEALKKAEAFFGLTDRDSYQYLLANLISSTPKSDVQDLVSYLSGIGGELEYTFAGLSPTATEVFIHGLCKLAVKYWDDVEYLGDLNAYVLGELWVSENKKLYVRGICNGEPGKYEFSSQGMYIVDPLTTREGKLSDTYELSAFDPIECRFTDGNGELTGKQILPAIVVKMYAINKHIADMNEVLDVAKMVILPEFSAKVFVGAKRMGETSVNLFKSFSKGLTSATGKLLDKCGKLGYKLKMASTEVVLYTNLNIEIARFSSSGKLLTKVNPYTKAGTKIFSLDDEIAYTTTANSSKTGRIELAKADDGTLFFREIVSESGMVTKLVDELDLGKFVRKVGDYEVYENGEVFFRTMSKEHYDELVKSNRMLGTGECTTSPHQAFSEGYEGVLVQFKVQKGTVAKLEEIGVAAQNNKDVLLKHPSLKSDVTPWNTKYARFKLEKGQVNIALGKGSALDVFNDNIIEFTYIKEIVK